MIFGLCLDLILLCSACIIMFGGSIFVSTFKNKEYAMFFKTFLFTATLPIMWSVREYIRSEVSMTINALLHTTGSFNTVTEEYIKTLFKSQVTGELVVEVIIPILFVLLLVYIVTQITKGLYSNVKTQLKSL